MYLSRLSLVERATDQPELWRSFSSPYAVHQAVWRMFPHASGEARDFLYRVDAPEGKPQVWTLSPSPPQTSKLWRRETKEVSPQLRQGDRLELEVRVNPVVTRARKRHDVIMDLKERLGWRKLPADERDSEPILIQRAIEEWLAPRSEKAGFQTLSVMGEGYRQDRFDRPGKSGSSRIELGICDIRAVIEVRDPATLLATWRQGLGPAKGFGCGLMLLKRTRP